MEIIVYRANSFKWKGKGKEKRRHIDFWYYVRKSQMMHDINAMLIISIILCDNYAIY